MQLQHKRRMPAQGIMCAGGRSGIRAVGTRTANDFMRYSEYDMIRVGS